MQGTVRKVNNWKTGKGFFFQLNETDAEYFGYGLPTFKVGDHVAFEPMQRRIGKATQVKFGKVATNTVSLSGKVRSGMSEAGIDVEEYFDAPRLETIDNTAAKMARMANSKDTTITRLACLKAAAEYSKGLADLTVDEVLKVAQKFEEWVSR